MFTLFSEITLFNKPYSRFILYYSMDTDWTYNTFKKRFFIIPSFKNVITFTKFLTHFLFQFMFSKVGFGLQDIFYLEFYTKDFNE